MQPGFIFSKLQKRIFLALSIALALVVASEAVRYLRERDSVDLCNKIIGARLLRENRSPYLYFWKEGDPQSLYNPYETLGGKVNSLTAPPSLLVLMEPLSYLSFAEVKWSWFLFSYLAILACIYLFSRLAEPGERILVWAFSIFFFLSSAAWLLHVERGQVYILYLFLLCCSYYFYRRQWIGFSIASLIVLTWLRFPFAIFLLPFLSYWRSSKLWIPALVTIVMLSGITLLMTAPLDWIEYRMAIKEWSVAQIMQTEIFADAHSETWKKLLVEKEAERDYLISNSSLQYLVQYHLKLKLTPALLNLLFMLGAGIVLFSLRRYFSDKRKEILFLVSFLIYVLFELCIPAPRYNYNYIQWLFPFLLLITLKEKNRLGMGYKVFFLLGMLMNMGFFFFIPRSMTIGEIMIAVAFWIWLWRAVSPSLRESQA